MRYIQLFILLALFASCDAGIKPNVVLIPVDVLEFVASQQLPKTQDTEAILHIPDQQVVAFRVQYGEPNDCPSGCFYSVAFGLRYQTKIGWVRVEDYDQNDVSGLTYFDVDSADSHLFSSALWDDLNGADSWFYRHALLRAFAKDPDTPVGVLKRLAEGLYTYGDEYLGWLLLDHPKIVSNVEILTIIANLPAFGEGYARLRAKAQELLNLLG